MVPPPPSMVSRTSFSEPRTPLACRSMMIEPLERDSTSSLNFWSVIPTMVSRGFTSAITSVIASAAGACASSLDSVVAAVVLSCAGVLAAGVSGALTPQAASPHTMVTHNRAVKIFFFIWISLPIFFRPYRSLCAYYTDND